VGIASIVLAGVALVISILSLIWSRRNAIRAAEAATRSADAAERAARSAAIQTDIAKVAAARFTPPWKLAFERDSTYRLTNANAGHDAHDVDLSFADYGPQLLDPQPPRDVALGESITFQASIYMGMEHRQLEVRWLTTDGPRAWRSDLPDH
jgi:type II secretory pathway pseudopilin PulG